MAAGTAPAASSYLEDISPYGTAIGIDVFVIGTNNCLYWDHWDGATWSNWANGNLGGTLTSSPAAWFTGINPEPPSSGNVYVFARGTNNAFCYRYYNGGSWGSWTIV